MPLAVFLIASTVFVGLPQLAVQEAWVLKVNDTRAAGDAMVSKVNALGGYFSSRTDDTLVLKVPRASIEALTAFAATQGIVVARKTNARDLGRILAEQKTRLQSREDVLERYFSVLKTAKAEAVVTVEHEMTSLVQEIESLKGQIKRLEQQLAFSELRIDFRFRDRRPPTKDGHSNFQWLHTVNLADLLGDFS